MNKKPMSSATMQGGAVAILSGLIYAWAAVFGWADVLVSALVATVGSLGALWGLYGLRRAIGPTDTAKPGTRAPRGFMTVRGLLVALALGACILAVGLANAGCTSITTGPGDAVEVLLDVGPPYRLHGLVNGKAKCTMDGTGRLLLRGTPGQCLIVGPDGIWARQPGGCAPAVQP